jgi:tripartite-type tricarboxylate transporter receptor subunit TctC
MFFSAPAESATKAFPTKPIRFLVGFPPGGGNDALTRVIAPKLADRFGVAVVIDNRPGAGGNLAAQLTSIAPPDGYTILMMFSPLVPVLSHLKTGRLRAVAVTSINRSRLLPDLPTISDAGVPGYEFVSWYGVLAPAATPADVLVKLNAAMNETMQSSDVTERVHSEDMDVIDRTPRQFDEVRRAMVVKWGQVVRETGLVAD